MDVIRLKKQARFTFPVARRLKNCRQRSKPTNLKGNFFELEFVPVIRVVTRIPKMDVLLQKHEAKHIYKVPEGLRELCTDISREVFTRNPWIL